jgi:hypothetical protein
MCGPFRLRESLKKFQTVPIKYEFVGKILVAEPGQGGQKDNFILSTLLHMKNPTNSPYFFGTVT